MANSHVIKMMVEVAPVSRIDDFSTLQQATPASSRAATVSYTPVSLTSDASAASYPKTTIGEDLSELYAGNIVAKIYRTATKYITQAEISEAKIPEFMPEGFPEYVPQDGTQAGRYVFREPQFWTCGFFPGSLHCLLERLVRYPQSINLSPQSLRPESRVDISQVRSNVMALCDSWAEPLYAMASRKDTHDVGFIIMPALQKNWELTGNLRSLDSIIRAAHSLASRFVPTAGAIRSWDKRIQGNLQITCQNDNILLIIDSMCNLDLLYYAASHSPQASLLRDIATSHAATLLRTHLRPEPTGSASDDTYRGQWYSTYHVANLDPVTGSIKQQFTAQGYTDSSTWARGQAWGILGYAQTYMWTKDRKFLQASCGLAEYLLHRLETSPACIEANDNESIVDGASGRHHRGRYVPLWDFDAPVDDVTSPTRDSSAGAIAANGMLVLSQGLAGLGYDRLATRFRTAGIDIVRDLLNFALAPEKAQLIRDARGRMVVEDVAPGQIFDGLLKFGTANNNENAPRRYANHGLVYGDYYLMEFGNRLLKMGFD